MVEDMQIRNLARDTQVSYVGHVARFARYCQRRPEELGAADVRRYQLH
jgi:hypothetical protein